MDTRKTALGTPCSPRWSDDWIARVEDAEKQLDRRICGGHGYDDEPCSIASTHPTGRCRYHGGMQNTGGQFDNANARIHGLYARRIQRCGPECPLWASCPMAGDDIEALHARKRPHCAYEREEYLELLRFYFKAQAKRPSRMLDFEDDEVDEDGFPNEKGMSRYPELLVAPDLRDEENHLEFPEFETLPEPFLLHQMIVLQIMVSRAAATLSATPLVDHTDVSANNYQMTTAKPAAALEAFVRLSREYRTFRHTIEIKRLLPPPPAKGGLASEMKPLVSKYGKAIEKAIREVQRAEWEERKGQPKRPGDPIRTEWE